ncbi:soluble lytic murein transglycosylase-like protein [Janthinobacterium sp. CG_23.3]|uniref:lytic transglycosylase domain-containing protein n=1 Tax=Janthinobacterium sp. CG_23.3 TaxID=3349634 RepID=UPI0038D517D1
MAIDDMFQEGTDKVLDYQVTRPLQAPPARPSFGASAWGTFKAPFAGVGAGANEVAGFASDMLGAFGTMQAGYGAQTDPSLLFDSAAADKRRVEGAPARARVQSGEAFSTETGTEFRARANSFAPDPQTASKADQILFGLTRFATKAVGYSLAAGGAPGAVMAGADEGMTEAGRLKAQGVDFETRTTAGAAMGVATAAAVALPLAGRTWLQTAGLYAAGGPGGFIAQQAASKAILQHAGYDQIADQYDPFDPVGLAVATLVPAGFGAYAMRGIKARPIPPAGPAPRELASMGGNERLALKHNDTRLDAYAVTAAQREGIPPEALLAIKNAGERSNPTQVSPAGAKGVMQFMDATWAAYGKGDPRDPVASIDAGARYMKDLLKQYDGDVRAAIAHYNGGGKAGAAVRAGRYAPAQETRAYLQRTDAYIAERGGAEAGRAAAADPEAVAAARVALVRETVESWNLRDPADMVGAQEHLTAVLRAQDQIGAGARVDIGDAVPIDLLGRARLLDDFTARLEQTRAELLPEAAGLAPAGDVGALRQQITRLEQSRPGTDDATLRATAKEIQAAEGVSYKSALSAAKKQTGAQLADIAGQVERLQRQVDAHRGAAEAQKTVKHLDDQIAQVKADRAAVDAPTPKPSALAVRQAVAELPAAKPVKSETAAPAPAPKAAPAVADQAPGVAAGKADANPVAAHIDAQAAEIAALSPDMMVQLEGMDAPMRLADALEAVKAEAARDAADAPLLQVAAECFLRSA